MNSRLYKCRVMHKRDRPKQHQFTYSCFLFCIDLDEIETLGESLTFFRHNGRNLYALWDSDHLDEGKPTIRENVISFLRSRDYENEVGRIELVTNLRTWGYVFNPVSFYFVYDQDENLACCVAEVANTFNEQKLYLVDSFDESRKQLKQEHEKLFYISPFSELDTKLSFKLSEPKERINLSITERDSTGTYFYSSVTGKSRELSNASLLSCTLRFPFITLAIIGRIHWQALRLTLKKVPFFRKNHRPDLQTETRPYLKPKNKRPA